jgi:hypothetical protein
VIEETRRRKYDYYYNLQGALQGLDAMMFGARTLLRDVCPALPIISIKDPTRHADEREGVKGASSAESEEGTRNTYALSVCSLREQQLKVTLTLTLTP